VTNKRNEKNEKGGEREGEGVKKGSLKKKNSLPLDLDGPIPGRAAISVLAGEPCKIMKMNERRRWRRRT